MAENLARDLPHCDQPLLAIFRSDANGCSVALCQRRQPPKAGAVGQRLQRVAGQPSLTIKSDGWSPVAAVPIGPRAALCEDDLDSGTDCAPFMRGFSCSPLATRSTRMHDNATRNAGVGRPATGNRLALSPSIRSATSSSGRQPHKSSFPVRSANLLSRPDLTAPKPRSATKEREERPRSHAQRALSRASMARLASTGPSPQ